MDSNIPFNPTSSSFNQTQQPQAAAAKPKKLAGGGRPLPAIPANAKLKPFTFSRCQESFTAKDLAEKILSELPADAFLKELDLAGCRMDMPDPYSAAKFLCQDLKSYLESARPGLWDRIEVISFGQPIFKHDEIVHGLPKNLKAGISLWLGYSAKFSNRDQMVNVLAGSIHDIENFELYVSTEIVNCDYYGDYDWAGADILNRIKIAKQDPTAKTSEAIKQQYVKAKPTQEQLDNSKNPEIVCSNKKIIGEYDEILLSAEERVDGFDFSQNKITVGHVVNTLMYGYEKCENSRSILKTLDLSNLTYQPGQCPDFRSLTRYLFQPDMRYLFQPDFFDGDTLIKKFENLESITAKNISLKTMEYIPFGKYLNNHPKLKQFNIELTSTGHTLDLRGIDPHHPCLLNLVKNLLPNISKILVADTLYTDDQQVKRIHRAKDVVDILEQTVLGQAEALEGLTFLHARNRAVFLKDKASNVIKKHIEGLPNNIQKMITSRVAHKIEIQYES